MALGVCPALRSDEETGEYYCAYAKKYINPAFMPCFGKFYLCEIYMYGKKKEEEKKLKEAEKEKQAREPVEIKEDKIIIPFFDEPIFSTDLLAELEELENGIAKLDELWENYESKTTSLVESWDVLKAKVERALAGLASSIATCKTELGELEAKYKLGFIGEEEYVEIKNKLEERLKAYETTSSELSEALTRIEKLLSVHRRRVLTARAKPEIGRLRVSLMKLEQLYESGKISYETYHKLRQELEEQLSLLERLVEEG